MTSLSNGRNERGLPLGSLLVLATILSVSSWGCGGGSNNGSSSTTSSTTLSGAVVQGAVAGAAISVFLVNATDGSNQDTLAGTTTDANGAFTIKVRPKPNGPVRITATGGTFASEQNGAQINSSSPLSVLLGSAKGNVSGISVNPVSNFVDSRTVGLLKAGGVTFEDALSSATGQIEALYGLKTNPSALSPSYTSADVDTDSGNLGLILGAIINEDQLLCTDAPGALAAALSADIADGVFDGKSFGKVVSYCGGDLPAVAGSIAFEDALAAANELQMATMGFVFGGQGNALTANGVAASKLVSPVAGISQAIAASIPSAGDSFAPAADTPVMNIGRDVATATLLGGGRMLIAGGFDEFEEVALDSTELYDPTKNCFAGVPGTPCAGEEPSPPMSAKREAATATGLPNGKVLIAGGFAEDSPDLSSTDIYDPANNCFAGQAGSPCSGQVAPSMNAARDDATATLLPNGMVLIAGGFSNTTGLASTDLYDPINNCFAGQAGTPCAKLTTATMNVARDSATATLLSNGKVLIAGGENFNDTVALDTTELYDPIANCFAGETDTPCAGEAPAKMTFPRFAGIAAPLPNGKVLLAGGFDLANSQFVTVADLYDPANNCFAGQAGTPCAGQRQPVIGEGRVSAAASILPNGKVLIAGGFSFAGVLSSTEVYDSANNCFADEAGTACAGQKSPTMNIARTDESATLLLNGLVLVAGGAGVDSTSLSSTELYIP